MEFGCHETIVDVLSAILGTSTAVIGTDCNQDTFLWLHRYWQNPCFLFPGLSSEIIADQTKHTFPLALNLTWQSLYRDPGKQETHFSKPWPVPGSKSNPTMEFQEEKWEISEMGRREDIRITITRSLGGEPYWIKLYFTCPTAAIQCLSNRLRKLTAYVN